jgi:hypothetical protein
MEEDTKNNQEQPSKEQSLLSSLKPSRKKVRIFSLCSSAIGVIACIFLLVRAYVYQRHGLRFTYTEIFINEKLFQGYESVILMYMSYLLQGIALNNSVIDKYPVAVGKVSEFLMIASILILFPSSWFYCSSVMPEFKASEYMTALMFIVCMTSNVFSSDGQVKGNLFKESILLFGFTGGTLILFINSFVEISF